jgi:hypothetical protein
MWDQKSMEQGIRVIKACSPTSAAGRWNAEHPDLLIQAEDRILAVNDVLSTSPQGFEKQTVELRASNIALRLQRGSVAASRPPAPPPAAQPPPAAHNNRLTHLCVRPLLLPNR